MTLSPRESTGTYAGQEITSPITGRIYEIAFYTVTADGGTGLRREQEMLFWREKPLELR